MFLEIKDFLNPAEVARLQELSLKVQFVDGRITNPHNQAKNNLQASETDPHYAESSGIVAAAYAAHAEGKTLETRHIVSELTSTRPLAVVRAEKVAALRRWAADRTVPTD